MFATERYRSAAPARAFAASLGQSGNRRPTSQWAGGFAVNRLSETAIIQWRVRTAMVDPALNSAGDPRRLRQSESRRTWLIEARVERWLMAAVTASGLQQFRS